MMIANNLLIIGVGLIGGSLGLALKKNHKVKKIVGFGRSIVSIERAKSLGIIDEIATDLPKAAKEADIIVLCTHLSSYKEIVFTLIPFMKTGTILTDIGSIKTNVIKEILPLLHVEQKPYFVPCHPIAGTEKSGPEAAFPDLFINKKLIITPHEYTFDIAIDKVKEMWEATGAIPIIMDSEKHDKIYAHVSHVIQFLAYVYMLFLAELPKITLHKLMPLMDMNYRRFMRLGGSSPALWCDVFLYNKDMIIESLDGILNALGIMHVGLKKRKNVKDYIKEFSKALGDAIITATPHEYRDYAGSGFKDFTSLAAKDAVLAKSIMESFICTALEMREVLKSQDKGVLELRLKQAQDLYIKITS